MVDQKSDSVTFYQNVKNIKKIMTQNLIQDIFSNYVCIFNEIIYI